MSIIRKGIILAGGSGSRLYPVTKSINKHLLPIYDKPMVYYALTTLMLAGIQDILVIIRPEDAVLFKDILGNGKQWGIKISYEFQTEPKGIAEAFLVGEKFIDNQPVSLILADNFFYGQGLSALLDQATSSEGDHATLFSIPVDAPERFGIVDVDQDGTPITLTEKPKKPTSNLAVTGLYFYDKHVVEYAKSLKPSPRGELEITDLNRIYLDKGALRLKKLGRGIIWSDMGLPSSLLKVANYVSIVQSQQSLGIGFPEEVAWRMAYINNAQFKSIISSMKPCEYQAYLKKMLTWK